MDPLKYEETLEIIQEEVNRPGPSVIITTQPCVLMPRRIMETPYEVDLELCNGCSLCFRLGCPAIYPSEEKNKRGKPKAEIDPTLCTGCTLCAQVCKPEAIILTRAVEKV
jgi:indolepyruvate ferredoxin oxidoreductase alpha subunit